MDLSPCRRVPGREPVVEWVKRTFWNDDLSGFEMLRRGTLRDLKSDARTIVDLKPARDRRGVSTPKLVNRSLIPPLVDVVVS